MVSRLVCGLALYGRLRAGNLAGLVRDACWEHPAGPVE